MKPPSPTGIIASSAPSPDDRGLQARRPDEATRSGRRSFKGAIFDWLAFSPLRHLRIVRKLIGGHWEWYRCVKGDGEIVYDPWRPLRECTKLTAASTQTESGTMGGELLGELRCESW